MFALKFISKETIEQELWLVDSEQQQTDRFKDNYSIDRWIPRLQ